MTRCGVVRRLLIAVAVLHMVDKLHGYPTGAPDSGCDSMMPNHGASEQTSTAPYLVTVSYPLVRSGQSITGILQSSIVVIQYSLQDSINHYLDIYLFILQCINISRYTMQGHPFA